MPCDIQCADPAFRFPRVIVTPALVAINVIVYIVMVARGVDAFAPTSQSLVAWGAGFTPLTAGGEWWRLLTSTFIHIGFMHLLMNMYVLLDGGYRVERVFGNVGFLVLYLASGLLASVTSHFFHPNVVCAGASGAIFGVYGALLAFGLRCPGAITGIKKGVMTFIAYNLVYGFAQQGIDMAAHLGGLATGFLCGLVMALPLTREAVAGRRWRIPLVAGGAAALVLLGSVRLAGLVSAGLAVPPLSPAAAGELNQAIAHLKKGENDQAIARLDKAIQLQPKYALLYTIRGGAYADKGNLDAAMRDCNQAVELAPKSAMVYAGRGEVYAQKGDHDKALADFTKAIELNPKYADAYRDRANACYNKGDYDKAIADYSKAIELNPESAAAAYNNRGLAYGKKGDRLKAMADYTRAIEMNDAAACINRGNTWEDKGNHDRAIADYSKAIELKPQYAEAYNHRANVFLQKKDYDKAWADVKKCQSLGGQVSPDLLKSLRQASGRNE